MLKLARRDGFTDEHSGDFKLINATLTLGQTSTSGFTDVTAEYDHLATGVFDIVSGTVNADTEFPDLSGDFQTWDVMSSSAPNGRINVSYEGRLAPSQLLIAQINVPIKGTGLYNLKIYVEGATTLNPVYETSPTSPVAAPANRSVLVLTNLDLSTQPSGERKYYVVIEAFMGTGKSIRVGLPYIKHE